MKDKTVIQISHALEMVGFIKSNGTDCRFVSMVSETTPKLRAGCPFKGVVKVSRKMGLINANYNNVVRSRIAAKLGVSASEVEYQNGEVWYRHETTKDGKQLPLVVNKTKNDGKFYLQYYPHKATNVYRMPNGDIVDEAQLKPWFYARKESEFKPTVIAIEVGNIKRLAASGIIMEAEDIDEAEALLSAAE